MNFQNDRLLKDIVADYARKYIKVGLGVKIQELEKRISELESRETPKRVGRPRKQYATNAD